MSPIVCDRVALPTGGFALVRRQVAKCRYCPKAHTRLCDQPCADGKTCDRKLCDVHATRVGEDEDRCPEHRP